jgi:3-oxoacyl-[acyl-carrier protein] reductase
MHDMKGKVALITGGSRGLGLAIATAFAANGIHVALGYNARSTEAERHAEELSATFGVRAIAVGGDVSKSADVDRIASTVETSLGTISILVNNAGVNPSGTIATLTEDDWNLSIAVNLTSAFLMTQRVVGAMREAKLGRILMISSVAAQLGGVIGPHYSASKAGMLGLMHSYAALLAKEGVTANAIAPALIETDMIKGNPNIKPELLPVGHFGKPEEVADVAVTLVKSSYITGQTFNVNGGWYHS